MNLANARRNKRKAAFNMQKRLEEQQARARKILQLDMAFGPELKKKPPPTPMHERRKQPLAERKIKVRDTWKKIDGKWGWHSVREKQGIWLQQLLEDFVPKKKVREYVSPFYGPHEFGYRLEKKGFQCVGSGAYATVYAKGDSDRVIKVGRSPDTDGWIDYTFWAAEKGYAGTWAPKVYSYKRIHIKGKTKQSFYVAVMERLEKTVSKLDQAHDKKYIANLMSYAGVNPLMKTLLDIAIPGLSQFREDLSKLESDANLDLHGGNFMIRKDGSFVCTDPLAGATLKNKSTRFKSKGAPVPLALAA